MRPRPQILRWLIQLLPLLLLPAFASLAAAHLKTTGKWTSKYDTGATWDHEPVHLVLSRGYDSYHSRVFWYDSSHLGGAGFFGGLWGWNPTGASGQYNCSAYPDSQFTELSVASQPIDNIFCSGHSSLADGRVLISGGTGAGESGLRQSILFRPSDGTWAVPESMDTERWYPTNTTLPDGRVLVSSGSRYHQMHVFGGTNAPTSGTLAPDSLQFYGATIPGVWDPPGKAVSGSWPAAREGHNAVVNPGESQWTIFGGRNANGTLRNDIWALYRTTPDLDDRENYTAIEHAGSSPDKPPERCNSSSIVLDDNTTIVFGGNIGTTTTNDVWQMYLYDPANYIRRWRDLTPADTLISRRQGHAAIWDTTNHKMLVFGGANISGAALDNTVYQLSFSPSVAWSVATVDPAAGSPSRPPARHGHSLIFDSRLRNVTNNGAPSSNYQHRAILFGGKGASQDLADVWVLWIPNAGSGANYKWQRISLSGTVPSARSGMAAAIDETTDRLIISGGDSVGVASRQTWGLPLRTLSTGSPPAWVSLAPHPQRPMIGHTMMFGNLKWSRKQEIFNAGSWDPVGTTKSQDWYPFHFVMPNADSLRVFYAGPDTISSWLNLTAATPFWREIATSGTQFRGGAAVMYRPGEFMKTGSRDTDGQGATARGMTKKINLTSYPPPSTWTPTDTMTTGRVNHNLVILPTGEVMVTGGTQTIGNGSNTLPVFRPQIWSPGSGQWTSMSGADSLAPDSTVRGYHSNAILLPDGRVLTTSGTAGSTGTQAYYDARRTTLYCPRYLFDGSGNLKTRPPIQAPDSVAYGASFNVCVDGPSPAPTMMHLALIRPSASTHAVNMDQRFMTLSYQSNCSRRTLVVTAPADGRLAPPGDYMFFAVKSDSTPALAHWIRIGTDGPTNDECVECGGGGAAMLAGWSASEWLSENSLLLSDAAARPLQVGMTPDVVNGEYTLRLFQGAGGSTSLDGLKLNAVDHDPGERAFAGAGRFLLGSTLAASTVVHQGVDVTPQATGFKNQVFIADEGDTVYVTLASSSETAGGLPLYVEARRHARDFDAAASGNAAVIVETEDGGEWSESGRFEPRVDFEPIIIDSIASPVRLIVPQRTQFRFVGHIAVTTSNATVQTLGLASAQHSRLGSVTALVSDADKSVAGLESGDTLTLKLTVPSIAEGKARTLFATISSQTSLASSSMSELASGRIRTARVWEFSLSNARPNPSTGRTTIQYTLARAARVQIRLYDVTGRLVRTLVDGQRDAGPAEAVWDGRDDAGRKVRSGVFFYRMDAGGWQSKRKLILLSGN